jgi:ribosomal protein L11 methyltransferase
VKTVLKPDGYFITSGVIAERAKEVVDDLDGSGFEVKQNLSLDGWHCIVGRA